MLFSAWVETVYHHRAHSETEQEPLARFLAAGPPDLPDPALLAEAFQWSERRKVTKTATISLHGNVYQVDAALIGRKVDLVFDPFDMTELRVRYQGRPMGAAVPHIIGRHVHPAARPDAPDEPAPPTGIDYLGLLADRHQQELDAIQIDYAALGSDDRARYDAAVEADIASFAGLLATADRPGARAEVPGQLALTGLPGPDGPGGPGGAAA